jgi:hypothetical protein
MQTTHHVTIVPFLKSSCLLGSLLKLAWFVVPHIAGSPSHCQSSEHQTREDEVLLRKELGSCLGWVWGGRKKNIELELD